MNYDRHELLDKLASAYVLGTLSPLARRRFEKIMLKLPTAQLAVTRWQARMAPLAQALPAKKPPADLWAKIEAQTIANVSPRSAVAPKRAPVVEPKLSWLQRFFSMGNLGLMATGAVLAFATFTIVPMLQKINQPAVATMGGLPQSYVAVLSGADAKAGLLVSAPRHSKELSVKILSPVAVAANQEFRLWALDKEGKPSLLGTIPTTGKGALQMPGTAEEVLGNVPFLGVTIAEKGVQVAALPESFLLKGPCVKLW